MRVRVAFPLFRRMLHDVVDVFCASELSREESAETPVVLTAKGDTLSASINSRGVAVTGIATTNSCEREGQCALKVGSLDKITTTASEILLDSVDGRLKFATGKLSGDIATARLPKHSTIQNVPLTGSCPSKLLREAFKAINNSVDGQSFLRFRHDGEKLAIWTHNSYNAVHSAVHCTVNASAPFDLTVPSGILAKVLAGDGGETIEYGVLGNFFRFKVTGLDVVHPIKPVEIEDIDGMVAGIDWALNPSFKVEGAALKEALTGVGSVDASKDRDTLPVELIVLPEKSRLIVAATSQDSSARSRVQITDIHGIEGEHSASVNFRAVSSFVGKLKGTLRIAFCPDRMLVGSDSTTVILTHVQRA